MDDRDRFTLEQLERRRDDSAQAMWLAPVITMAAQAFLLQVLSGGALCQGARMAVLAAGVLATIAALWTLLRSHSREVLFSEVIAGYGEPLGLPDVRPGALRQHLPKDGETQIRRLDQRLVCWADGDWLPPAFMVWGVALVAFIVADVAVYLAA